ncbi:nicotinamide-nucleotide adenylyltransferase [Candidatus Peregrinibacteria bacterium]|jgi:nicotinamide-nucleotide adenylyltransferase|nr:nicotinamide-nucleotide adenylyltransferase [Candidatus Peregrinibacteria bacterium]MBT4147941.1 nicotinamide-nucleotide adenylyltransferase [Candidatus Peregrinibacteria bacterium]MBT4456107.1 nicotinamide-nucleotide adenylyltransferase [Candidatus Peregrinibacteria bacterium]
MKPLHKTGLFVGRFQPFHLGHLDIIKKILKQNKHVILAIGSAERNYVPENPLTAGERVLIIDETLKAEKINPAKYTIIPIRNIDNYALWVDHMNLYVPPYDRIYTGSPIVKACYEGAQSKHKLVKIKRKRPVSATEIRNSMLQGTKDWQKLVPPRTAELLEKMKIPRRLRHIQETMSDTKYK